MLRHIDLVATGTVHEVVVGIRQSVNILAPQLPSDMRSLITLPKVRSFSRALVFLINDIVSGSAFVGVANLILILHFLNPFLLSILLVLHELPALEISFVFLNAAGVDLLLFDLTSLFSLQLFHGGKITHESVL